jgi:ABC-type multidrug transport system ATPase subunit
LPRGKQWYIENAIAYIDQLDKHAPRLTVDETFEFAFQCKAGGTLKVLQDQSTLHDPSVVAAIEKADKARLGIDIVLACLGLTDVRNTFVGNTAVRGVSGGQRRRVTVGEMVVSRQPVLCGDEISTGLDAASTYDMIQVMTFLGKLSQMTRVFALLQPSPESVSLFDDVIVMSEGRLLYAGPISDVETYFADIGYKSPLFMDVADFLQTVSTEDGASLYQPEAEVKAIQPNAPTVVELAEMFQKSEHGERIRKKLAKPPKYVWKTDDDDNVADTTVSHLAMAPQVQRKYANSFWRNSLLILNRFLLLWTRDKRVIIAAAIKNILMGVSVGGVFSNVEDEVSLLGALFQAGLFIMLGKLIQRPAS